MKTQNIKLSRNDRLLKSVVKTFRDWNNIFESFFDENGKPIFEPEEVKKIRVVFSNAIMNGEKSLDERTRRRRTK